MLPKRKSAFTHAIETLHKIKLAYYRQKNRRIILRNTLRMCACVVGMRTEIWTEFHLEAPRKKFYHASNIK
jgi:hypothetical protein